MCEAVVEGDATPPSGPPDKLLLPLLLLPPLVVR